VGLVRGPSIESDFNQCGRVLLIAVAVAAMVIYNKRSAAGIWLSVRRLDTYNAPLAQRAADRAGEKPFLPPPRATLANQQFVQLANRYGFFEAGKTAEYFAGLTAIDTGQTGPAETYLKKVADGMTLLCRRANCVANLYQQMNRNSEAVVLYNQLIAKQPTRCRPMRRSYN